MIFFSSDNDFEIFYKEFCSQDLNIELLVTESAKKQGRNMEIRPNPAHQFALDNGISVETFDALDEVALNKIKDYIGSDRLGFIFAYGKIIPERIINLFENGILNIHFSLLPKYPGASPIQQALLDGETMTGYTVFEITKDLDQGKILIQKQIDILKDDNFDTLRSRIICEAAKELPAIIKKYLKWEITLTDMPKIEGCFTRRISKSQGLISPDEGATRAYNKIRAFSRWPKAFLVIDGKRYIIHSAALTDSGKLQISEIQPEGKKTMNFNDFKNGYCSLLTKMPKFVNID